nr:hypothetical protein [uncultured Mediterranean phage uvMED]
MKNKKPIIDYGMSAEMLDSVVYYSGPNYKYTLTDESFHNHKTLVVAQKHLNILENNTGLSEQELKKQIIEEWFSLENELVREANNKKRREK